MALLKEFSTQHGPSIKATYWHVCAIEWRKNEAFKVQLAVFANAEDRAFPGSVPILRATLDMPVSAAPPSVEQVYAFAKADPGFSGAQDG
jgi:hypothetical protein